MAPSSVPGGGFVHMGATDLIDAQRAARAADARRHPVPVTAGVSR